MLVLCTFGADIRLFDGLVTLCIMSEFCPLRIDEERLGGRSTGMLRLDISISCFAGKSSWSLLMGTDGRGTVGGANIFGSFPIRVLRWIDDDDLPFESLSTEGEVNDDNDDDNDARLGLCSGDPKSPVSVPTEPIGERERALSLSMLDLDGKRDEVSWKDFRDELLIPKKSSSLLVGILDAVHGRLLGGGSRDGTVLSEVEEPLILLCLFCREYQSGRSRPWPIVGRSNPRSEADKMEPIGRIGPGTLSDEAIEFVGPELELGEVKFASGPSVLPDGCSMLSKVFP